jgi:hypothetical protein
MIIWNIHALTDQLRGRFSARQIRPYLMAAVLLASLMFVFADWSRPWDRDSFEAGVDSLTTLLNGAISAGGVYWCYKANGGSSGMQLAERLCALGVVLFVRFAVWSVLALIAGITLFGSSFQPTLESFDLFSVLLIPLFWIRLSYYVAAVRTPRA